MYSGYLSHIERCNRWEPARWRAFCVAGVPVGRVREDRLDRLAALSPALRHEGDKLVLEERAAVDDALLEIGKAACAAGLIEELRGEAYPVRAGWAAPVLGRIDRALVALFGLPSFGLHVNGLVAGQDGELMMWVARRARDRAVAPGQLDNLVAGGQPADLSLARNLLKEAAEEADIPAAMAASARPVGCVSYCFESGIGLKRDTMFLYDLWLPADFTPRNTDGEIEDFFRQPLRQIAETVAREPDAFKFNCNLVIVDCLIRHGLLDPDDPDFPSLANGLHRPV